MRDKKHREEVAQIRSLDLSDTDFALHAGGSNVSQHAPALATEAFRWRDVSDGGPCGKSGHEVSLFEIGLPLQQ